MFAQRIRSCPDAGAEATEAAEKKAKATSQRKKRAKPIPVTEDDELSIPSEQANLLKGSWCPGGTKKTERELLTMRKRAVPGRTRAKKKTKERSLNKYI